MSTTGATAGLAFGGMGERSGGGPLGGTPSGVTRHTTPVPGKALAIGPAPAGSAMMAPMSVTYSESPSGEKRTPTGRFVPPDEPAQAALGEKTFRLLSDSAGIVAEDLGGDVGRKLRFRTDDGTALIKMLRSG